MDEHDDKTETPNEAESNEESSDVLANVSRRTVLSSLGAGAATLALGTGTAAANEPSESPAAAFAEETSAATSATGSGAWSDPSVWDSGLPGNGADARIGPDASVTLGANPDPDAEVVETARIKTLVVEGDLTIANDVDTHLRAETVVTTPGSSLEIGTETQPIQPDTEAKITFVHHEDISEKDIDPERISKGLIVMGDVAINGAEKTAWDELATAPTAGDTSIELPEAPTNWQEGDDIVIPGVNPDSNEDEERTISNVSGTTVSFDDSLEYDHEPPSNELDVELTAYALNLSRSVVMESEIKESDPHKEQRINRQGHVMIMTPATSINYARFIHVGRTNKKWLTTTPNWGELPDNHQRLPDEPNPLSRYGFHYHETGIGEDPHEAEGLVVQDNPGWGVVNHHSHANVRDSITYRCLGAGFSAEAGDERGDFEGCFALRSRGSGEIRPDDRADRARPEKKIFEFGFEGSGFWLQGPTVGINDCVAAGHAAYGFAMWSEPLWDGDRFTEPEDFERKGGKGGRGLYANFPKKYAREDGLMVGNYTQHPDGPIPHHKPITEDMISIQYLTLKSFSGNTAFASIGGVQIGGKQKGPFSARDQWPTIKSFTGYNFTRRIDGWIIKGRRGNEGGIAINQYRYGRKLRVIDAQLTNNGAGGGWGVAQNAYAYMLTVKDSTIEGYNQGIEYGDFYHWPVVENVTFGNEIDIQHKHRSRKAGNLEMADLTAINGGLNISFSEKPEGTTTLDGREIYFGDGDHPEEVRGVPYLTKMGKIHPVVQPAAPFPGDEVTFDASAVVDTDAASNIEWTIDDETTLTGASPTHTFESTGQHVLDLTATMSDGSTETFTRHFSVIEGPSDPRPAKKLDTAETGLRYEYYEPDSDLNRMPDFDSLTPERTGLIDDFSLDMDHRREYIAVRFTGYIDIPRTDTYTFWNHSDNESEVYIDGQFVDAGREYNKLSDGGSIELEEGRHEIEVQFIQRKGDSHLRIYWASSTIGRREIPPSVLSHSTATFELSTSAALTGKEITFDASDSAAPESSITGYEWTFGDGSTATGEVVEHSFSEGGAHTVKLTVITEAGATLTATETVTIREYRPGDEPGSVSQGLSYEYYETGGLQKLPNFDALEPARTGTTGAFGLGPDHRNNEFAFRFTGYISVPEKGTYTFTTESDNGSALYIGSEQVVDNDGEHSMQKESGEIALSEGLHEITVTYFESHGGQGLNVFWSGPNTDGQIRSGALYHTDGENEPEPGPDADETVTVAPGNEHTFSPGNLEIDPGTTVAFEWDSGGHTVTVDSKPDDAAWSGVESTQSAGSTHTHTFDVPGTYEYHCSVHSDMQGTITVEEPTSGPVQSPYERKAGWPLPGRVQAENFDAGGGGTAYADESTGNIGGDYRDTQVDIDALGEDNYHVGWMHEGEWLEYTVKVQSEGTYDLTLRVASQQSGTVELAVSIGDTDVGPVTVPQTDGWDDYTTVTVPGVQLAAGEQVLRIDVVNTGGHEYGCNLDWVEVTESEYESVPQAIDADDDGTIEDDEILDAVGHWKSGEPVPNTGGQTVTDETVMDLVDMWKEETDITEGDQ
jgi:plastocyanin